MCRIGLIKCKLPIQFSVGLQASIQVVTSKLPSIQKILFPSCVLASALSSYLPSGTVCGVNGIGGELRTA